MKTVEISQIQDNLTNSKKQDGTTCEFDQRNSRSVDTSQNAFDLDGFIAKFGLDVSDPQPFDGGRKWIFRSCPWRPEDKNSAFLIQFESGAISAGCQHDTCPGSRSTGNHWSELRRQIEGRASSPNASAQEKRPPLKALEISLWGLRPAPQPAWLLERLLARGETGILAGRPNCGKGLLSMQLAFAIATGRPLWGRPSDGTPRTVLQIQMEDSAEEEERRFSRCLDLWRTTPDWNSRDEQLLRQNFHCFVPDWGSGTGKTLNELLPTLEKVIENIQKDGKEIGLILLDTLAALSSGDENTVEAQREIWPACFALRDKSKALVLVVHHTRKASGLGRPMPLIDRLAFDGLRGSSAISAGARVIIQMEPLTQSEAIKLELNDEKAARGGYVVLSLTKVVSGPKGEMLLLEQLEGTGSGFWALHPNSEKLCAQLISKRALEDLSTEEALLMSVESGIKDRAALAKKHWPTLDEHTASTRLKAALNHLRHRHGWLQRGQALDLTVQGVQHVRDLQESARGDEAPQCGDDGLAIGGAIS